MFKINEKLNDMQTWDQKKLGKKCNVHLLNLSWQNIKYSRATWGQINIAPIAIYHFVLCILLLGPKPDCRVISRDPITDRSRSKCAWHRNRLRISATNKICNSYVTYTFRTIIRVSLCSRMSQWPIALETTTRQ